MAEKKNIAKGDSYRLAFGMINSAIRHVFPLQAIAIEESILSDRLWAVLNVGKAREGKHETLGKALMRWKELHKSEKSPFDEEMESLYGELSRWWDMRNKMLHGIVKSFHGEAPSISAESLDHSAMKAAVRGKELADKVVSWSHKQSQRTSRVAEV